TVFLDEIGEVPLELQPKLLRVLESREIRRIGANQWRPVDVRVISATNRDLRAEVNRERFRSDLYYRLAVVTVTLPPLRERPEDLPLLAEKILTALDPQAVDELLTPAFVTRLRRVAWPGNVRELRNYLERCLVFGGSVPMSGMPRATNTPIVDTGVPFAEARKALVDDFERAYLDTLLREHRGKVAAAARASGIDRVHLYRLLKRHGLRE
ncbi:MAG: sigma 54-interacting transcriptional regulator, partial [Myxococcota bacterium]